MMRHQIPIYKSYEKPRISFQILDYRGLATIYTFKKCSDSISLKPRILSGRVARAGRSGTAYSLVSGDEVCILL